MLSVTKSPLVSLNDEHGDTLGTEQNADEQYVRQLERNGRKIELKILLCDQDVD